jgi:cyclophilin family peptidyl-prolyl cis-trans isomerase
MRPGLDALSLVAAVATSAAAQSDAPRPPTTAEVLEASEAADWRPLDPARTLYLELATGRVVIELAPRFAPRHVANIETLVRAGYFDGLAILRSQDNYVVQWGDPEAGEPGARPLGDAAGALPPEFDREMDADVSFTPLPDGDVYAPEVGFVDAFPAARDPASGRVWLAHCYGMVGVGRDDALDSGSGTELYVVTGHAPRHLDRNVTLVGRVVEGMPHLSTLPRGGGPLGFYESPEERAPVERMRMAVDVPEEERTILERLRTDTQTFEALVQSRRVRQEEWFATSPGKVGVCNVPLPVRPAR